MPDECDGSTVETLWRKMEKLVYLMNIECVGSLRVINAENEIL